MVWGCRNEWARSTVCRVPAKEDQSRPLSRCEAPILVYLGVKVKTAR